MVLKKLFLIVVHYLVALIKPKTMEVQFKISENSPLSSNTY